METEKKEKQPLKLRLFGSSEEMFTVARPSALGFERIRNLALQSAKVPLHRKFDICKELALDWKVTLNIENRKVLDKLLENIKTNDPCHLGEKILQAKNITERYDDNTLSAFDVNRLAVSVLFRDSNGATVSVTDQSADDLLIGNIEKAMAHFFEQINISDDETDLFERRSFRAFTTDSKEYPLAQVTVKSVREMAKLQVATPSIPESDRKQICDEMRWPFIDDYGDDALSKVEYWRKASQIVLQGVELNGERASTLDVGEINRALTVFFAESDGLL